MPLYQTGWVNVRAAADIVGTTVTTSAAKCFGAKQVMWRITATGTNNLSATTVRGRRTGDTLVVAPANDGISAIGQVNNGTSLATHAAHITATVTTAGYFLAVEEIALDITSTGTTTAVAAEVNVIYECVPASANPTANGVPVFPFGIDR